jgi:hypothetical protein
MINQLNQPSGPDLTAAVLIGAALALILPGPLQAQSAEQHARDMNDIAATPQAPNGNNNEEEPKRYIDVRPSKPGSAAMAYHDDTGSSWVTVAHRNLGSAKKQALDGCNAATGGGCYIAATYESSGDIAESGEIFIAEDAMGRLWGKANIRRYGDPYTYDYRITDPARLECQIQSFGCSKLTSYHNGHIYLDVEPDRDQSENFFPKGKLQWNRWAMVARPTTPTTAAHNKSWLISGKENSAKTAQEIVDRCKADSGVPCSIWAYAISDNEVLTNDTGSANGLLVHFVDARGENSWTSAVATKPKKKKYKKMFRDDPDFVEAPDPVTPKERVDRLCSSSPCRVIATYDAATLRMQVIEDVK